MSDLTSRASRYSRVRRTFRSEAKSSRKAIRTVVGLAENDPLLGVEGMVEVDHDERKAGPGQVQGLGDPLGLDQFRVVEVLGRGQRG